MPVFQRMDSFFEYDSHNVLMMTQNSWSILSSAYVTQEENVNEFDVSLCQNSEFKLASLQDGLPENLVVSRSPKGEFKETLRLCFDGIDESEEE